MALDPDQLANLLQPDGGALACSTLQEAYATSARIARTHYENFPVGSVLVDAKRRPAFTVIYTFARLADDVADQLQVPAAQKLQILAQLRALLVAEQPGRHPVFLALQDVRKTFALSVEPFERLITAFEMDSQFEQPATWAELLHYCSFSANPVGELLLSLYDECDARNLELSNAICSALQLINFWQDLSRDLVEGRTYIPADLCSSFNTNAKGLAEEHFYPKFPASNPEIMHGLVEELLNRSEELMRFGSALPQYIRSRRLRMELCLIIEGGMSIIYAMRSLDTRIFRTRPTLNWRNRMSWLWRSMRRYLRL